MAAAGSRPISSVGGGTRRAVNVTGAERIVVVRALTAAPDPHAAAAELAGRLAATERQVAGRQGAGAAS